MQIPATPWRRVQRGDPLGGRADAAPDGPAQVVVELLTHQNSGVGRTTAANEGHNAESGPYSLDQALDEAVFACMLWHGGEATMTLLLEPTDSELADAVQQNLFDLFRSMARLLPNGECEEGLTLCRHFSLPTNPMFKGVWGSRLGADEVERTIDTTIAWFSERKAPYFFWWTGPGTEPANLGEALMARGLLDMAEQQTALAAGVRQTTLGAPTMALDLTIADDAQLLRVPPGFVIDEVRSDADLDDFKRVFVEVYAIPEWAGQAWVDATRHIGIGKTPWRMFVGRLDGRPVATNMLFCGGGVASVYAVATVADARGRGIGGAITLSPLLEARRDGYRHAVLFSTELGVGAYQRIGFRVVPGRINRYLWRAG